MSSSFTYEPHVGYGPLKFMMSSDEVQALLGEPRSIQRDEEFVVDWDIFDESDKAFIIEHETWIYDDAVADHDFLSVRFVRGELVEINVFSKSIELAYNNENLLDKKRKDLMRRLAAVEPVIYANGQSYFFPRAGVSMTDPKFWKSKGTVDFVVNQYILDRVDFNDWDKLDEIDF